MTTTDPRTIRGDAAERDRHLGALVREHEKALLAYTEKLLNDHHLAQDIVQETLVRAWHHAERLVESEGSVRGWLLTVARNLVIDQARSGFHRYEVTGADMLDVTQRDHADAVVASVAATEMLGSLSDEHRDVLVHIYLRGRTVREAADDTAAAGILLDDGIDPVAMDHGRTHTVVETGDRAPGRIGTARIAQP